MFSKITLTALAAATAMTAVPAAADARPRGGYYNDGYSSQYDRGDRYQRGDYYRGQNSRYYGQNSRYYSQNGRYYGRNQGYYRQRCRDSGTTGTVIGGVVGALLGREVAQGSRGRGDGTAGLIIGGAAGALAGRAIDRNC